MKVLRYGLERRLSFQTLQNLLLIPGPAGASEFAEVIGEQSGDVFAVMTEIGLKKPFFKHVKFRGVVHGTEFKTDFRGTQFIFAW